MDLWVITWGAIGILAIDVLVPAALLPCPAGGGREGETVVVYRHVVGVVAVLLKTERFILFLLIRILLAADDYLDEFDGLLVLKKWYSHDRIERSAIAGGGRDAFVGGDRG